MALVTSFTMTGCLETLQDNPALRNTGFYYAGWKVASETIEHSRSNAEAVQAVEKAIGTLLAEDRDSILFEVIEEWYEVQRETVALPEIEKQLLEEIFIIPFWNRMKEKYGGTFLVLDDPHVRADLASFARGLNQGRGLYEVL